MATSLVSTGVQFPDSTTQTTALPAPSTAGNVLTSNGTNWTSATAGGTSYVTKVANYTAAAGDLILADTSGGSWTLTLPASPTTGSVVTVLDAKGTFGVFSLFINPGGNAIMNDSTTLIVGTNGQGFGLVYNGTQWRIA